MVLDNVWGGYIVMEFFEWILVCFICFIILGISIFWLLDIVLILYFLFIRYVFISIGWFGFVFIVVVI